VLLLVALGTGTAAACDFPKLVLTPTSAAEGEVVGYEVKNAQEGARYTLDIDGRVVTRVATHEDASRKGEFVMPAHDVVATGEIVHETGHPAHDMDSPWPLEDSVRYEVPAPQRSGSEPSPADPPAADQPASVQDLKSNTGEAPQDRGRTQKGASGGPRDARPPTRSPGGREPAPRSPVSTPSPVPVEDTQSPDTATAPAGAEPQATGRSTVNTRSRSTVNGTDGSAVTATDRRAAAVRDRSAVKSKSQRTEAIDPITPPRSHPSRSVPRVQPPGKTIGPLEDGDAIPGIVLVGLSALLVLGVGAVAIWVLYPRGSPPGSRLAEGGPQWIPPGLGLEARSRDLLIEAELQEMIAEERARRLPRETAGRRTR
jgi:hypothetical protein